MSDLVTELNVLDSDKTIFDTDMEYVIPLYQRAFAWEDKQLTQLIEDITDITDETNYYIGSLIVSKQNNKYEVVDGQQRLTSLYLLLNCLELDVKDTLTFACREKSNYTLRHIKELLGDDRSKLDMDRIESGIYRGMNILKETINKGRSEKKTFKEELKEKLKKVIVYRIEVPEHTDLNRYFEIMNTRGEQLEQHDILKAKLMKALNNDEKAAFARIWDACSDMTGYVQMHFISKNNEVRKKIFGGGWNVIPSDNWRDYVDLIKDTDGDGAGHKITDIIRINDEIDDEDGYFNDEGRVRFESIIEFPYFLIHVLKVLINCKNIKHEEGNRPIIAELLDDKKLKDSFEGVINHGVLDGQRIAGNEAQFAREYIVCLLRTRFLFDKYIIKREFTNEDADGEWSLKSLEVSKKKPYYRNSRFIKSGQHDKTNDWNNKTIIMLQSALRVSYTSPKVMHWITNLLLWLSEDNYKHLCDEEIVGFETIIECEAKEAVKGNFFERCEDGSYAMGVNTPHIVFNYLDYLIWNKDRNTDSNQYGDFVFEFRNSVEHWYPQHPSDGTIDLWTDGVDQFGNLCIIQRNVNSKFSNLPPEAKKSAFYKMIKKGSLKLRKMSEKTEKNGVKAANAHWKDEACQSHEEEMIEILKKACYEEKA